MKDRRKRESQHIVVSRRCDEPMADKKGLLPCEGGTKCFSCIACLEQDLDGEWSHCDLMRREAK